MIFIVVLVYSVVIHEVSHGVVAERLGDPTARLAGRLTLNPIPHIDLFGSIILPVLLRLAGLIPLGAAKPVPVNFANLRNPKRDMALVALAGPGSNFLLAILCAIPLRLGLFSFNSAGGEFLLLVVLVNLSLGIFNLVPIPPLDGSKVLASLLADRFLPLFLSLERYGIIILIIAVYIPVFQNGLAFLINFLGRLVLGYGF